MEGDLRLELMPPLLADDRVRELASLAEEIRISLECGQDPGRLIDDFNAAVANPCLADEFLVIWSCLDVYDFVRIALAPIPTVPTITKDELLELIRRIHDSQYSDYERIFWERVLEHHIVCPYLRELLGRRLEPEEVLGWALGYWPSRRIAQGPE